MGDMAGLRRGRDPALPEIEAIDHVHTPPGNSSGIVDGAAAVLIGNRKPARRRG
jgi:acetyl-CoA C-acetyltransferase